MNKIALLGGALAALIANAGVASAQQYPDNSTYSQPYDGYQNDNRSGYDPDRFFQALHELDLRWDQRRAIHEIFRDVNGDRLEASHRIIGVLDDGQRHHLFAIIRGDSHETYGVVGDFNEFDMHLQNGTYVHLHQGTIINPLGFTLHPGVFVAIHGYYNRDGSLEANRIDVRRRDYVTEY